MARRAAMHEVRGEAKYDCIYCLRQLDGRQFNREHVLSGAFGAFAGSPVLHYCVCRECNQFFGDQLEVRFARGAFEGMLRYQRGVRTPPEGVINLPYVELAIPGGRGDWSGVRLKLVNDESGLHVTLIPQAAFFDESRKRWVHVKTDEIEASLSQRPDFKKGQIRIYARSAQEHDAVVSKLTEHGVNFRKAGELHRPDGLLESPEMEVEITLTVNQGVRRCIAKYAFNYLALVSGSEFVRGPDFNLVRRFIRYGGVTPYPLVVEGATPILYRDRPSTRQTAGHLLTLSWTRSLSDLVAQVSLFNILTYRVSLCRGFTGRLWRPIRSGIHYDLKRNTVEPLLGFPQDLTP